MTFSIRVDWSEELKTEKWENVGRSIAEESCKHKHPEGHGETSMRYGGYCEECDFCEDSAIPMMNFAYPLETTPDDEKVLEVVKRTNCTVMRNTETDEFFLVLCGGGMNLSQDIALAYHLIENWIPFDLATSVCTQEGLSVGGKDWTVLKKAMQKSLALYKDRADEYGKRWA